MGTILSTTAAYRSSPATEAVRLSLRVACLTALIHLTCQSNQALTFSVSEEDTLID